MALKSSKITSEIIQTCNKFLSSSADNTLRSKVPVALLQSDQLKAEPSFRYKIANTGKPDTLPELNFQEEPAVLFADLQPSASPEFRFDYNPTKWVEKSTDYSPFPASIKRKQKLNMAYTDQQKAEDKMLKCKMACFKQRRQLSTTCARLYSKAPADNSGSGHCKKKVNKCYKTKPKHCKAVNNNCPRFKIMDCEQSKGSQCKLNYLDPHCCKKFAPYPSYSESCAENLPDDPSECHQCPWRTCDEADSIEPGKPVRNKRHYSTMCSRHLEATGGVVGCPVLSPDLSGIPENLCHGHCGKSKKPCKQPPGPCEVRKHKESEKKREKTARIPPKPKKALDDSNRMVLTGAINQSGEDALLNRYTVEALKISMDQPLVENKGSWLDLNQDGEEMFLDHKQKHPNCHKKKKPKRPKADKMDQDLSIEYGNVDWWSGRGKKAVIIENEETQENRDCKIRRCPDYTIRNKKKYMLATTEMLLSKKKKIKGDEGHPPPCHDQHPDSLNCPSKPIKKPKYKKRPMDRGYYKKPGDPYSPSNGK